MGMGIKSIISKAYIDSLRSKDATHKLSCSHAFNEKSRYDYYMDCIILKEMPNDRLKILVFGERNRKGYDDKKQIRYVDRYRVVEK
ncbi:hypothetical protein ES695_00965 [Candidatus Atribacteria bacterium 1244-E10-H5-B2]|nr:MAG: hypothetical protein ES695_00965 [Candidatus Atribacteria bacterium 1244-E10-H5-B2]